MKPRASLPRVFGKMRADTVPFIVGQIRGISLAVHGAKLRPPSRSPSTFQTVSGRGILRSSDAASCIVRAYRARCVPWNAPDVSYSTLHLGVLDRYAESCLSQSYCLVAMMGPGS